MVADIINVEFVQADHGGRQCEDRHAVDESMTEEAPGISWQSAVGSLQWAEASGQPKVRSLRRRTEPVEVSTIQNLQSTICNSQSAFRSKRTAGTRALSRVRTDRSRIVDSCLGVSGGHLMSLVTKAGDAHAQQETGGQVFQNTRFDSPPVKKS